MKNKIMIAGTLFLMLGMTGTAQQTQQAQFNPGQVFGDQNTRLNAGYAVNEQGDFYGFLFSDDQANFFGTVDSFESLQGENIRICQHYLAQTGGGGFFEGILGNEQTRTTSQVKCVPFRGELSQQQGQLPVQPQNQTQSQQNQTQQEPMIPQQNQTQQPSQMSFPDVFYAYDANGESVTYVINNQGEISNVFGTVEDINQLSQDSIIGCEYFFQAEALAQAQNPSEVNCYGYEELQNRSNQGQIPYLDLANQSSNQTQQNQTQGDGLFG